MGLGQGLLVGVDFEPTATKPIPLIQRTLSKPAIGSVLRFVGVCDICDITYETEKLSKVSG